MKKWMITVPVTISLSVTVEADTAEEALELASEAPIQTLCHQCSSGEPGELAADSLDGDPDFDEATITDLKTGEDVEIKKKETREAKKGRRRR